MKRIALLIALLGIVGCDKTIHEVKLPAVAPLAVSR
jgi:hypothetical protein